MQILYWQGRSVSVNKWTAVRVIKKGGKHIAMVYKTTAYKKFIQSLADAILSNQIKAVPEGSYIDILIGMSMWKMRDSDSAIKPILDAMELSGIVKNDRYIRDLKIERWYHKRDEPDVIQIFITKIIPEKESDLRTKSILAKELIS